MHPTHSAAAHVIRQSIGMFREALTGLPDASLDWTPLSGMSSIAVLTTHSLLATRRWAGVGLGETPSQAEYRATERPDAFRARGGTVAGCIERLTALEAELIAMLERADPATLDRETEWVDDAGRALTGAEALIRAIAHLREHVGHAQVMRDLWLAASREGH
ncbi:MAG: DinB family protein [Dehalococcoidia bacterium]|nr:DinB family protein [Dehalococcoidia bacterium]